MMFTYIRKGIFCFDKKREHYIVQSFPFKIFKTRSLQKKDIILRKLSKDIKLNSSVIKNFPGYFSLEVITTTRCNLSCDYCFAKNERDDVGYYGLPKQNMSIAELKKAIDISLLQLQSNLQKNKLNDGIFDIYFMGGEPLLNKGLLFSGMKYIHKKVREIEISSKKFKIQIRPAISTNGTLLDENTAFFLKNIILVILE